MRAQVLISFGAAALVALAGCRTPGEEHRAIQRAAQEGEVTLSGCLQHADPDQLVLANAMLATERTGVAIDDPAAMPPLTGRTTPTGTIPVAGTGPHYAVEGPPGVDLEAHVGRQVQMTGIMQDMADPDRPVGTAGEVEPRDVDGHLSVQEVRLIAERCM